MLPDSDSTPKTAFRRFFTMGRRVVDGRPVFCSNGMARLASWPGTMDATKAPSIVVLFPTKAGALYFFPLRKNWSPDI